MPEATILDLRLQEQLELRILVWVDFMGDVIVFGEILVWGRGVGVGFGGHPLLGHV